MPWRHAPQAPDLWRAGIWAVVPTQRNFQPGPGIQLGIAYGNLLQVSGLYR